MVNVNFVIEVEDEEELGKWIDVTCGNTDSLLVSHVFAHVAAGEATIFENEDYTGTRVTVRPGHLDSYETVDTLESLTRYLTDNW